MAPRSQPPDDHLVTRRELLDSAGIARALRRIASEIVEKNAGQTGLALVGIRTGGYFLAERLARLVTEVEPERLAVALGAVDITLYRDDVFQGLPRPEIGPTEIPFDIGRHKVVLVDDVLYTGRTVRAALDALMDYGRPRAVELAVLVDRGHRELPIQADYVGLKVTTARTESVRVLLAEDAPGTEDRVLLREKTP
ncbi:MAG: bifunctional pyr operon transcriptional regulator/uracil phosphoribosyltransferase PyrR [Deltaproteobacteria bacterium]|nr:bifunctional pyr operon transcriptional regulator/uracil phosphoribosyltransferase PyrR [Deltaproteobacteria bacterium]